MAIANLYNRTFTVRRKDVTGDGAGRYADSFVNTATNVPGRIRRLAHSEREDGQVDNVRADHRVYMSTAVTVEKEYQLVLDDGTVYEVVWPGQVSKTGHHQEIDVYEIVSGA